MAYTDTLNSDQLNNISIIRAEMERKGITNPHSQAALLAIVSKESSFMPKRENMNYSAGRIQEVWTGIGPAKAKELAYNPQKLANYVYVQKPLGYRTNAYGNTGANDGWRFRGGGFNQLTFKDSFKKMGDQIGEPLGTKPELIENPNVAAKASVQFFLNRFKSLKDKGKLQAYGGAKDINDFSDSRNAVLAFYHANTGAGKDVSTIKNKAKGDSLGGMKRALDRVPSLYELMKTTYTLAKKNPIPTAIITSLLMVSSFVLYKLVIKKK